LTQPPVGTHCLLELRGCDTRLLNDQAFVESALADAASASGATLLNTMSHRFEPQGVTAIALLAESHLSIHTWPELGYAAVDLFTCGTCCDPQAGCRVLAERFAADAFDLETVERGGSGAMRFLPQDTDPQRKESPCPVPN